MLIGELSTASEEFSAFWAAHDIRIRHEGTKRLHHPEIGEMELTYQSVDLPTGKRAWHDLSFYAAEPGSSDEDRLKLLASWAAPTAGAMDVPRRAPRSPRQELATRSADFPSVEQLVLVQHIPLSVEMYFAATACIIEPCPVLTQTFSGLPGHAQDKPTPGRSPRRSAKQ